MSKVGKADKAGDSAAAADKSGSKLGEPGGSKAVGKAADKGDDMSGGSKAYGKPGDMSGGSKASGKSGDKGGGASPFAVLVEKVERLCARCDLLSRELKRARKENAELKAKNQKAKESLSALLTHLPKD